MRKPFSLAIITLASVAIVGFTFLFLRLSTSSVGATSAHPRNVTQTYSNEPGAPAITPHLSITSKGAGQHEGAAFTEADVRQYIATHPLPARFTFSTGSKPIIVKIEFLLSSEVNTLVGESTGMPAPHLLCYVELKGSASVAGPSGSNYALQKIYEVFDAQTGNLLMIGGK